MSLSSSSTPGLPEKSEEVLAAIRSSTDKHIFLIIDTSADEDHAVETQNLSKAGWALPHFSSDPVKNESKTDSELPPGASIIAH